MKCNAEDLTSKVERNIRENGLLKAGSTVIVGVSGGADSTVLLKVLHHLRKKYNWKLIAAHLNHGLRGREADEDENFCRNLARRLKVTFVSEKLKSGALENLSGSSLEDAARQRRHTFLEKVRKKHKAQRIVLGHNRDDQVETVLFRLMRGTSLRGLSGMDFASGNIIRPLLNISRSEILDYCQANKITFREDSSNRDERFIRNRIRLTLLPLMEKKFNPKVRQVIYQTSFLLHEDSRYLESQADEFFAKAVEKADKRSITLNKKTIQHLPAPILSRVLIRAFYSVGDEAGQGVDFKHIQDLTAAVRSGRGGLEIALAGNLTALVGYGNVLLAKKTENRKDAVTFQSVEIKPTELKRKKIDIGHFRFHFRLMNAPPRNFKRKSSNVEYIDYGKIVNTLVIRPWHRCDSFTPLGLKGRKKISDLFVDSKIDRRDRHTIPLLCDGENIIWVVGIRMNEHYKITSTTRRVLRIEAEKIISR